MDTWLADNTEKDITCAHTEPIPQADPVGEVAGGVLDVDSEAAMVLKDRRQFDDNDKDCLRG